MFGTCVNTFVGKSKLKHFGSQTSWQYKRLNLDEIRSDTLLRNVAELSPAQKLQTKYHYWCKPSLNNLSKL